MNIYQNMRKTIQTIVLYGLFSISLGTQANSYDDFFRAVVGNDHRTVERLVARGFDPNARDPDGHPAIVRALRHESFGVARALIKLPGFDPEARNTAGETGLMMAAIKGESELVRAMISQGAAINHPGWTPLHYAAAGNSLPAVKLLLEQGAIVDARSPTERTPLMMAVLFGGEPVIDALLAAGADIRAHDLDGRGVAELAAASGRDWLAQRFERQLPR